MSPPKVGALPSGICRAAATILVARRPETRLTISQPDEKKDAGRES
jgi:hypothetical protein